MTTESETICCCDKMEIRDGTKLYTRAPVESVLNRWVKQNRENWVPRPGEDDVLVHDIALNNALRYDYNPRNYPKSKNNN